MCGADQKSVPHLSSCFGKSSKKYLSSSKTGGRYHPMIIGYCLGLTAKLPAVYDEIRYDEKNSGFVILPRRRRLRDYKNYIRPIQGFNETAFKDLRAIVSKFQVIVHC